MKKSKEELKQFFETGDKPTQQQYADLIDSYIDAKQLQGEANRRFVIDATGEVSVASEQKSPEYTLSDIINNKLSLLKDEVVVKELDLTNYIDDTNLARLVSGTLDINGIATFTRDDNSTFTVDLSNLKDTIEIKIKDSNGTEKFAVTNSLRFDDFFDYNATEKEIIFNSSRVRVITSKLLSNSAFLANVSFSNIDTTTTVTGLSTSIGRPFNQDVSQSEKIFKIDFLNDFVWRRDSSTLNDVPKSIKVNVWLKPNGGSFFPSTSNKEVLLYSIKANENSLQSLTTSGETFFYNNSIPLVMNKILYYGTDTTRIKYSLKEFDLNENVVSTTPKSYVFYNNNSGDVREIDNAITFSVFMTAEIDNTGVTTPTQWGGNFSCKHYLIEKIK
ncbi:hypothetical protein [uncultured Tenacibaculum sp.]|uniref:hypothetical protein n=1 Tax=uncultured Tenacibaculum sp. TaxID=174713 RepID=UPI0026190FD9|nr:hypothetical protein [uncultured Tenacibaculum sp.]